MTFYPSHPGKSAALVLLILHRGSSIRCTIYYVLVAALVIFSHVVRDPTDPEAETDVSYLRLFATTLRKSSIGTGSPHIEALQALAELILSIAEPIVHHHQQGQLQQRLKPPSIVLPEPSSRHVPYTPGQHEQPLSVSMIPTMCAGPSSAIPQNHDHSLSSAVNAAGSIFDFLFQPSENVSRHLEAKSNLFPDFSDLY